VVFLDEPLSLTKVAGAASVLVGVALTRTAPQAVTPEPCEP
jgi:drug/metabolite transporter (DMT)-like permease